MDAFSKYNLITKKPTLVNTKPTRPTFRATPWIRPIRERLAEQWCLVTNHPGVKVNEGDWASSINNAFPDIKGHMSLPCSIRGQADEIGFFLMSDGMDDHPQLFLKMYLFLLAEFCGQLQDMAGLLGFKVRADCKLSKMWNNRWSKHNLSILLQHHPQIIFADELGADWHHATTDLTSIFFTGPAGKRRDITRIDTEWLSKSQKPDLSKPPLGETGAVVLVPPLRDFLCETMDFFCSFLVTAVEHPSSLLKLANPDHQHGYAYFERGSVQTLISQHPVQFMHKR